MIIVNLAVPELIEPGATVLLDASASFDAERPFSVLRFSWSCAAPGALADAELPVAYFTAPTTALPGETFRITVTVSGKDALGAPLSTSSLATLTATGLLGRDAFAIRPRGLPEGRFTILPRGAWQFEVELTAPDGAPLPLALLRALDPGRFYLKLSLGGELVTLPALYERAALDRWTVYVQPAAAGERLVELRTEHLGVTAQEGRPTASLGHDPLSVARVIWLSDELGPQPVEPPFYRWSQDSRTISFDPSYAEAARLGTFSRIEVDYYWLDPTRLSGWYASRGLGPFDQTEATLTLVYGEGPFLDLAGGAAVEETRTSLPVRLAGSRKLNPYYDVWLRQGRQALLREPYQGILVE